MESSKLVDLENICGLAVDVADFLLINQLRIVITQAVDKAAPTSYVSGGRCNPEDWGLGIPSDEDLYAIHDQEMDPENIDERGSENSRDAVVSRLKVLKLSDYRTRA